MVVKIKTGFSNKTDNALSAAAQSIIDQMTTNVADYPLPSPALSAISTAKSDFDTAKAFKGGPAQTALKNQYRAALIVLLNSEALYVQKTCGNDRAKALRSGYPVWASRSPVGVLPRPVGFSLKTGKDNGWVEASMQSYGSIANSYVFRYSQDPDAAPSTWTIVTSSSASKTIMGLEGLKMVYVQGAGVGANPNLVWSQTLSIGVL